MSAQKRPTTKLTHSEGGHWQRLLTFKSHLMQRDPAGREVIDYVRNHARQPWDPKRSKQFHQNLDLLRTKYWCNLYIPDIVFGFEKAIDPETGLSPVLVAASLQKPLTWTVNWDRFGIFEEASPKPDEPTLTTTVDLRGVTQWDLERLAREFKAALREALRAMPKRRGPHTPPSPIFTTNAFAVTATVDLRGVTQWDLERLAKAMRAAVRQALRAGRITHDANPPELSFLRTVTERQFIKALRRYDLHLLTASPVESLLLWSRNPTFPRQSTRRSGGGR